MRLTDELDRLVLAAVCDDFVTLESIIDKLSGPGVGIAGKLDAGILHCCLFDLIADKLVSAYLLHADPPYITPVEIGDDALPTCWFYITQRGKKCLANSARQQARLQHKNVDPPKAESLHFSRHFLSSSTPNTHRLFSLRKNVSPRHESTG